MGARLRQLFSCVRPVDETDSNVFVRAQTPTASPTQWTEVMPGPKPGAETYPMNHRFRGKAVVFNHSKFKGGEKRKGAEVDEKNVTETFRELGFEVETHHDLKKSDVLRKLQEVAAEDHSNSDCLAVVVMSHGKKDQIMTLDGSYAAEMLWNSFLPEACRTLAGKPKLFFIQACRGKKVDSGVKMRQGDEVDGLERSCRGMYTLPVMADCLISYATFDGFYAWRDPFGGSWFIEALCTELKLRLTQEEEILSVLTAVNRRVATQYASHVPNDKEKHQKKQMPAFTSTLTRSLVFRSKAQRETTL